MVVLTKLDEAPAPILTPPPDPPALFPVIVELMNVEVAPTPLPLLTPPPPVAAMLPLIVVLVNVARPLLVTPPPPARLPGGSVPFLIVNRLNDTVAAALTSNTRSDSAAPLPLMIAGALADPVIVRSARISRSPDCPLFSSVTPGAFGIESTYVPGGTVMVSAPLPA